MLKPALNIGDSTYEQNWKFHIGEAKVMHSFVVHSSVKLFISNICQASTKCEQNLKTQFFCSSFCFTCFNHPTHILSATYIQSWWEELLMWKKKLKEHSAGCIATYQSCRREFSYYIVWGRGGALLTTNWHNGLDSSLNTIQKYTVYTFIIIDDHSSWRVYHSTRCYSSSGSNISKSNIELMIKLKIAIILYPKCSTGSVTHHITTREDQL